MRYLVDTDWAIHYSRGHEPVRRRLGELRAQGLGLSIVSLAELYEGVERSTNPLADETAVQDFLALVELVGLDAETARIFGRERARLRVAGTPLDGLDLLIGATALRHDLTLLTNNRRHFDRIGDLAIESV
ncbi:MAG: type II toxin-antitoxin system VapC family toxin [Chloroflexota bacterium]|nr:type II toxin-antitoxin system VapC family toxin [Chloroflexota bacterium]